MFRPLGLLTLQLPNDNNQYIYVAEVGIPLLEGGLLYRSSFSGITESSVMDLHVFVDKYTTDLFQIDQQEADNYLVSVLHPFGGPVDLGTQLVVHADPENAQLFSGQITQVGEIETVKFIYRDINEPITLGVIALVAIGAMAVMCIHSRVLESRDCHGRIKATYGMNWRTGELGCTTECLEKTKSSNTPESPSIKSPDSEQSNTPENPSIKLSDDEQKENERHEKTMERIRKLQKKALHLKPKAVKNDEPPMLGDVVAP